MFVEDEFIAISSLQHYIFCPRQCGLIHVEDAWQDNLYTVRGEILHEKVDTDTYESRGAVKTVRGLRIQSCRLGLTGRADVVEFFATKGPNEPQIVQPVEYKAGEPKDDMSDAVQLCAQALCLEEMLGIPVMRGVFFYGKIRRRVPLEFDQQLRQKTEEVASAVHELVTSQLVPPAEYGRKCRNCSMESICQPKAMNETRLQQYLKELYLS